MKRLSTEDETKLKAAIERALQHLDGTATNDEVIGLLREGNAWVFEEPYANVLVDVGLACLIESFFGSKDPNRTSICGISENKRKEYQMKHGPNGCQDDMQIAHVRQTERIGLDSCISCHLHASYSVLERGMKILRTLAMRKRPQCNATGACNDSGRPMRANEPPQVENCECRLTQDLACAVMDIQGQLDLLLDKADRLALIVNRSGDRHKGPG